MTTQSNYKIRREMRMLFKWSIKKVFDKNKGSFLTLSEIRTEAEYACKELLEEGGIEYEE